MVKSSWFTHDPVQGIGHVRSFQQRTVSDQTRGWLVAWRCPYQRPVL